MSQGNPAPNSSVNSESAEPERTESDADASPIDASAPDASAADAGATDASADASEPTRTAAAGEPPQRKLGPLASRGLGVAKPASPSVGPVVVGQTSHEKKPSVGNQGGGTPNKKKPPRPRLAGEKGDTDKPAAASSQRPTGKVAVPSLRDDLADDIQAELDLELAAADIDSIMSGPAGMPDRKEPIADGARVPGQVLKIHNDSVYISLGGPDEGVIPFEQFTGDEPQPGQSIEVISRGLNSVDGLYVLSLPGAAVEVDDWDDIDEGAVVSVTITGHNAGGLECKLGGVRGFIPMSQIADYRVEDLSEFVDQQMVCVVTEANAKRGNLIVSRRAILEREREERKKEQLEKIQQGDEVEGVVRSVKDFGAFVDLGGLDGLIHVSKLSWDRIKHPSEVLEVGQKVRVVIERLDKETGKVGLSYRDLLENPWDTAEAEFAMGTVCKGTVTKIADFGCFVRLTAGVEGLVHISELAHHRVSRVDTFVTEGQEVEVKVLSFDRDAQKISLSMKAAGAPPVDAKQSKSEEEDEPQREPAIKATHSGPLKGGNNTDSGGERFGLRW